MWAVSDKFCSSLPTFVTQVNSADIHRHGTSSGVQCGHSQMPGTGRWGEDGIGGAELPRGVERTDGRGSGRVDPLRASASHNNGPTRGSRTHVRDQHFHAKCVARGGGLEPPMTGPEPAVLPITPPPKGGENTLAGGTVCGISWCSGPSVDRRRAR